MGSQLANALALLVSAVGNTAANRRLTFGVRGRDKAMRHQAQGLVVFGIGLALTSGSLAALNAANSAPAQGTEIAVLVAANLAATVLRFLLFRAWVFPSQDEGVGVGGGAAAAPGSGPRTQPAQQPLQMAQPAQVRPGTPYEPYDGHSAAQGGNTPWRVSGKTGYGDETMRMRPLDPHEHDPRSNR
jgi:putative flippase GtrA